MKLYSRRQIIFSSVCTALIVFLGALGFGIIRFPAQEADTAETTITADDSLHMTQNSEFQLQTGTHSLNEPAVQASSYTGYTEDEKQNISVYELCNEAVVNITTETMAINWFLEPVPQEGASGSGSIIDTRGYVLTNTHVIENAYKIFISLSDGSQYPGTVIGTDKENDLAVLKFEPPEGIDLKTIAFGESDKLKVGQKVLAIGNPFGLERTLTTGIVSGLGRPIQSSANNIIKNMIQTDTAINPGNSGGPLIDTQGRLIGINTMIYSTSGSSAGVGFAVPVNTAKRVVSEILTYGKVRRGTIDADLVQLTQSIARYAKLTTDKGLLVSKLAADSSAGRSGLRGGATPVRYGTGRNSTVIYLGGDVITSIDNQSVATLTDYYSALESHKPGDVVPVTVVRGNQQISLKVTLAER